jgi:hypothetical protein
MIELEDADRSIEIERDVLELHGFPRVFWSALFPVAVQGFQSRGHI